MSIRTSERKSFRRCPQRWWWAWRMGYTPPLAANSLWFGEGVHIALASWYRKGLLRGPHPAETFADWVGSERRRIYTLPNPHVGEDELVDAKELGVAMLEHYVRHYGKDEQFAFISTEQTFRVMIGRLISYLGTFDGVYRDRATGKIWLIEHKTAKQINTLHLTLDDQAGSYWAVATATLRAQGLIKPTDQLIGIKYNFLRKAMPDDREQNRAGQRLNKDGSVSRQQPQPYFLREEVDRTPAEQRTQIRRIQDEAAHMLAVRTGQLPLTKNTTRDCHWDCPFFNMCELHEAGDDWRSYADAMYEQVDPYAAHRKSAAE